MNYDNNYDELREWIDDCTLGVNDCDEKDQLISIILEVLNRIPSDDRDVLTLGRNLRFVVPIINCTADRVVIFPSPSINNNDSPQPIDVWLVCLNSEILKDPKDEIIYTIAHELAHVYLEHSKFGGAVLSKEDNNKREIDTDKQVIKWGFESELRKSKNNYIYRNGSR